MSRGSRAPHWRGGAAHTLYCRHLLASSFWSLLPLLPFSAIQAPLHPPKMQPTVLKKKKKNLSSLLPSFFFFFFYIHPKAEEVFIFQPVKIFPLTFKNLWSWVICSSVILSRTDMSLWLQILLRCAELIVVFKKKKKKSEGDRYEKVIIATQKPPVFLKVSTHSCRPRQRQPSAIYLPGASTALLQTLSFQSNKINFGAPR